MSQHLSPPSPRALGGGSPSGASAVSLSPRSDGGGAVSDNDAFRNVPGLPPVYGGVRGGAATGKENGTPRRAPDALDVSDNPNGSVGGALSVALSNNTLLETSGSDSPVSARVKAAEARPVPLRGANLQASPSTSQISPSAGGPGGPQRSSFLTPRMHNKHRLSASSALSGSHSSSNGAANGTPSFTAHSLMQARLEHSARNLNASGGGGSRPISARSSHRGSFIGNGSFLPAAASTHGSHQTGSGPHSGRSASQLNVNRAVARRPSSLIAFSHNESNSDDGDTPTLSDGDDKDLLEIRGADGELVSEGMSCVEILWVKSVEWLVHRSRHPALDSASFFFVTDQFVPRLICFNIVSSRGFEGVIIVCILANCVVLAMDDPTDSGEPTWMVNLNYFFTAAYSLEMFLKIFAFGFVFHRGAYLRVGWNRLDFVIVLMSWLQLGLGTGQASALRAFRVLRPLRSMNAIPPLRQLVTVLLRSLTGLANVLLLIAFLFGVFGIFAVQLFKGTMRNRCMNNLTGVISEEEFCTSRSDNLGGWLGSHCSGNATCVVASTNPNHGFTSYDNILWASLVIIQVLTMEDWAAVMYYVMSAWSWFGCIYFVLLVIVGSYLVLNLALAVISAEFEYARDEMEEIARVEAEKARQKRLVEEGKEELRANVTDARALLEQQLVITRPSVANSTVLGNGATPSGNKSLATEGYSSTSSSGTDLSDSDDDDRSAGRGRGGRGGKSKSLQKQNSRTSGKSSGRSAGNRSSGSRDRSGAASEASSAAQRSQKALNSARSANTNGAAAGSGSAVNLGSAKDTESIKLKDLNDGRGAKELKAGSPIPGSPGSDSSGSAAFSANDRMPMGSRSPLANRSGRGAAARARVPAIGALVETDHHHAETDKTKQSEKSEKSGNAENVDESNPSLEKVSGGGADDPTSNGAELVQLLPDNDEGTGANETYPAQTGGTAPTSKQAATPKSSQNGSPTKNDGAAKAGTQNGAKANASQLENGEGDDGPHPNVPADDEAPKETHHAFGDDENASGAAGKKSVSPGSHLEEPEHATEDRHSYGNATSESRSLLGESAGQTVVQLDVGAFSDGMSDRSADQAAGIDGANNGGGARLSLGSQTQSQRQRQHVVGFNDGGVEVIDIEEEPEDPDALCACCGFRSCCATCGGHGTFFACVQRAWNFARYHAFWFVEGDPELYDDETASPEITWFGKLIILCIMLNTAMMAAYHHGQSEFQQNATDYANYVFTGLFTLELMLKVFGLGFERFGTDPYNVFDSLIVVLSLIEIGLGGDARFSVLRSFRLLRVFKLFKSFPSLLSILEVIAVAVKETAYLNVLIILYLFIASLFGMQFFGGKIHGTEDEPARSVFDNFYLAFFTVFQILTRDDWPGLMHAAMDATSVFAFVYFIIAVIAGDLIILNLFLSIIISSFDKVGEQERIEQQEAHERQMEEELVRGAKSSTKRKMTVHEGLLGKGKVNENELLPGGIGGFNIQELWREDLNAHVPEEIQIAHATAMTSGGSAATMSPADGHALHGVGADHGSGGNALQTATSEVFGMGPDPAAVTPKSALKKASPKGGEVLVKNARIMSPPPRPVPSDDERPGGGGGKISLPRLVQIRNELLQERIPEGTRKLRTCEQCGDAIVTPYPTPAPSIRPPGPRELHDRFCDKIQVRKAKQRVAVTIIAELEDRIENARKGKGRAVPTVRDVEDIFGRAWEVGLLLGEDLPAHIGTPSWQGLIDALNEEREVLKLFVGEDQIGGALVAYTRGNIPSEVLTNGGTSLWIFGRQNKLRVWLTILITDPWFDRIILVCIVVASLILAFDDPRDPTSKLNKVLETIGDVFTGIFIAESVVKIVALGFVLHHTAYLRDWWNVLDFAIVIVSILSWSLGSIADVSFLKVLRTFRALRPLRVINRNRGLKMVVLTLLESLKGIFNVAMITVLIWLIFAVLGTQLFGGRLYSCNDGSIDEKDACVGWYLVNQSRPLSQVVAQNAAIAASNDPSGSSASGSSVSTTPQQTQVPYVLQEDGATALVEVNTSRQWVTFDYNFDNSYNSFLQLFVIATLDDWATKMYRAIDATDTTHGPKKNNNPYYGLYFISFIMVGSFFLLSFFVGVVIFQYNRTKEALDGLSFLTPEQKHWVETQRMVLNFRPTRKNKPPKQDAKFYTARFILFQISESMHLEITSAVIVMLNILVIATDHYDQSKAWDDFQTYTNFFFVFFFFAEAVVKIIGLMPFQYFVDGWNQFDFFLVLVGFVSVASSVMPINPGLLRVLRVFRMLRLMSLVKKAKRVRILVETLWYSLPSLGNITLFLLLVFFIFSVLGVQLFANVKVSDDGEYDDEWSNFKNFQNSFLMLLRITTQDNWGVILTATSNRKDCGKDPVTNIDNCGTVIAPLYYFTFLIIAVFVLLNVFVAVILDNFNTTMKLDHSEINIMDLKKFSDAWAKYDEDAEMLVDTKHFVFILAALKPPLGIERRGNRVEVLKTAMNLRITEHGGTIHFVEVLVPLARAVQNVQFTEAEIRDHEEIWKQQFPALNDLKVLRYRQKRVTVDQYLAATHIQSAYRRSRAFLKIIDRMEQKLESIDKWYDERNIPSLEREASQRWGLKVQRVKAALARQHHDVAQRAVSMAAPSADDLPQQPRARSSTIFGGAPSFFAENAIAAGGLRSSRSGSQFFNNGAADGVGVGSSLLGRNHSLDMGVGGLPSASGFQDGTPRGSVIDTAAGREAQAALLTPMGLLPAAQAAIGPAAAAAIVASGTASTATAGDSSQQGGESPSAGRLVRAMSGVLVDAGNGAPLRAANGGVVLSAGRHESVASVQSVPPGGASLRSSVQQSPARSPGSRAPSVLTIGTS